MEGKSLTFESSPDPSELPLYEQSSKFTMSTGNCEQEEGTTLEDDWRNDVERTSVLSRYRKKNEKKLVGLKNHAIDRSVHDSAKAAPKLASKTVEQMEKEAREFAVTNQCRLLFLGITAACKVMAYYLITLETLLGMIATVCLTCYWYFAYLDSPQWTGGGFDFILLAFAVTSPIAAALGMAFTRRERALLSIADFRSTAYHVYVAHCFWDYTSKGEGGRADADIDWLDHCDAVLAQLVGIGDELSRFLSLPTASRSRHRMMRSGRREAAKTLEAAYHLMESMTTQRVTRLILYSERLKKLGLGSSDSSRLRQYERYLTTTIEQLRMVKMYRTPQALRSFARVFTLLLPAFYAPDYAQLAREVQSLPMGILFGIITVLCLTALFESLQILEDPFTAYLALDGIDVHEEFEVLLFAQLMNTRMLAFPDAPPYPAGRRAALMNNLSHAQLQIVGQIPYQYKTKKAPKDGENSTTDDESVSEHQDVELGAVLEEEGDSEARDADYVDAMYGEGPAPQSGLLRRMSVLPNRRPPAGGRTGGMAQSLALPSGGGLAAPQNHIRTRRSSLALQEQAPSFTLRNVQTGTGASSGRSRRTSVVGADFQAHRKIWE